MTHVYAGDKETFTAVAVEAFAARPVRIVEESLEERRSPIQSPRRITARSAKNS